jgi:hypothetical protein
MIEGQEDTEITNSPTFVEVQFLAETSMSVEPGQLSQYSV